MAHRAARSLDKGGQRCSVVDALITQGIALARLRKPDRAQYVLQQAIRIALEADALNRAGMAALTMIEEIQNLSPTILQAAYQQAREWLSDAQSSVVLLRLNDAAGKLAISIRGEVGKEAAIDALLKKPGDLEAKLLDYEHELIKRALLHSNGSVTNAGKLLGITYQGLTYILTRGTKIYWNCGRPCIDDGHEKTNKRERTDELVRFVYGPAAGFEVASSVVH